MRHRALLTLALLAALAPALAGCVGSAQASAMEAMDPAEAAAKKWSADAQLTAIHGAEGGWPPAALGATGSGAASSDFDGTEADQDVGDGRCAVWVYRYFSAAKAKAYVVVVKDDEIMREGEEGKRSEDRLIGEWSIDSDRALTLAKEANEGFRRGVESEHYGFFIALQREAGAAHATWSVAGGGGDDSGAGGGGYVLVDAVDGKVLKSSGGYQTA